MIFDTFNENDILTVQDGRFYWKGSPLPDETVHELQEQAAMFQHSMLWKMLKAELQWYTLKTLMEKGESADDLRFAKLMGTLIRVQDEWLERLGG